MNTTTISAMQLRDRIGDIFNRVGYAGERFIVERRGKAIAAIISVKELEYLERLEEQREVEKFQLAKAAARAEGTVPIEELVGLYEELHGESLELPASV